MIKAGRSRPKRFKQRPNVSYERRPSCSPRLGRGYMVSVKSGELELPAKRFIVVWISVGVLCVVLAIEESGKRV